MATGKVDGGKLQRLVTVRALFLLEVDSRCLHLHGLNLVLNYFVPNLGDFALFLLNCTRLLTEF
jgi:hypothetical protein